MSEGAAGLAIALVILGFTCLILIDVWRYLQWRSSHIDNERSRFNLLRELRRHHRGE